MTGGCLFCSVVSIRCGSTDSGQRRHHQYSFSHTSNVCNAQNSDWSRLHHTTLVWEEGDSSWHGTLMDGSAIWEALAVRLAHCLGIGLFGQYFQAGRDFHISREIFGATGVRLVDRRQSTSSVFSSPTDSGNRDMSLPEHQTTPWNSAMRKAGQAQVNRGKYDRSFENWPCRMAREGVKGNVNRGNSPMPSREVVYVGNV
jgi:hypothetical protein